MNHFLSKPLYFLNYNRWNLPCILFNRLEGYFKNSACCQLETINSRIQLNPMITVSLMQMIGSETRLDVLAAAIPAPW